METKFYLVDRYSTRTLVDEPGGWEGFSIKTKRHPERHGTFREVSGSNFQFYDKAASLLRKEYEQYGAFGKYNFEIFMKCGGSWTKQYAGKISFNPFSFTCDNGCSVSVTLDTVGPLVKFINRFDQDVDVSSLAAFDGTTSLADYPGMVKEVLLPSKAIKLFAEAKNAASQEYILSNDAGWFPVSSTGALRGPITVPFDTTVANTVNSFSPRTIVDFYNQPNYNESPPWLLSNEPDQLLHCVGTQYLVSFRVKGRFKNLNPGSGSRILTLTYKKGTTDNFYNPSNYILMPPWFLNSAVNTNTTTAEFDITHTGTITLLPGEHVWLNPYLEYVKTTDYIADVRIEFDPETFFKAEVVSKCDPTTAKLYLVNEVTSRVIEHITDGSLKLYSEYYGRPDSAPYAFPQNGCGALKAITPGIEIRRAKLQDGSDPKLFLSMKSIFEGMAPIDNIGIGMEGDDKIRIEPWTWFYQNSVVFTAIDVPKLVKKMSPAEHWSAFTAGYDTWETEGYDGLDEFLTKRTYKTQLDDIQSTLEKTSKFIASGYAWETTRRKQADTTDWRYDNNTFVVCLKNQVVANGSVGTAGFVLFGHFTQYSIGDSIQLETTGGLNNGTFTVTGVSYPTATTTTILVAEPMIFQLLAEIKITNLTRPTYDIEVGNLTNAANVLDPATVYNARISPARNAMRWFSRVAQCYRNIQATDEMGFASGDGNYVAEMELVDPSACKLESGVLKENDSFNFNSFIDTPGAKPIMFSDRVEFEYPMSFQEFNGLMAQPYGLIDYRCKTEAGKAWIDELEYFPSKGTAKFSLIPKTDYA